MMALRRVGRRLLPWAAVIFLWGSAAMLAASVSESEVFKQYRSASIAKQLFGNSTLALAEHSFMKADTFYHGGRERVLDKGFTDDFFQDLLAELKPTSHVHLHDDQIKEVMAWMQFAMSLDPENSEYVMTTSYWLGRDLHRADLALQVIDEAIVLNPRSYELHRGRGQFYAKGGDTVRAKKAFEEALRLWPGQKPHTDEDARQHMREILGTLEVICELEGDNNAAVGYMTLMTKLFPDRSGMFKKRMDALVRGEQPQESAERRWNSLRRAEYEHFCSEEQHDEQAAGHADHESDDHDRSSCGHDH